MDDMVWYYPQGHERHAEYGHPERPERVDVIVTALQEAGLWETFPHLDPQDSPQEVMESVHERGYLERLEKICSSGGRLDLDTYATRESWILARNAAGGAVAVAKSVWHRQAKRGLALTRPPGHHATINRGMGFCLLNNVSIAAEHLLQREGAIRLAIVDLDLHHGNGTQDIFWNREDVLYISTHQYPHYPGSGLLREIGGGRGKGATANFPMPPGSGDRAYLTVMDKAILPLLTRFMPDMLLVSYGFDTHWLDPLGDIRLSADGYARLISSLAAWADDYAEGRIALFLEGGYDLEAAVACTQGVVAALLGKDWSDPLGPSPNPERDSWQGILRQALQIWGLG